MWNLHSLTKDWTCTPALILIFFSFFFFLLYFGHTAFRILVPQLGIKLMSPTVEVWLIMGPQGSATEIFVLPQGGLIFFPSELFYSLIFSPLSFCDILCLSLSEHLPHKTENSCSHAWLSHWTVRCLRIGTVSYLLLWLACLAQNKQYRFWKHEWMMWEEINQERNRSNWKQSNIV